ncbi:MAG: hypothetical protein JNK76_18790 [Planctomycetales bacterium]|nr:hypothetical protein [Planctomycetales bacterium]MBN8626412.1 hypothetical protein [Planctomycetota bacterium]
MFKTSLLLMLVLFLLSLIFRGPIVESQDQRLGREQREVSEAINPLGLGALYTTVRGLDGMLRNEVQITHSSKVTDRNIYRLSNLTAVVGLDLSDSRISDVGISQLDGLPRLRYLQLARTQITDEGLRNIARFKELEAIDLTETKVTQAGAEHLRQLPKLKLVCAAGTSLTSLPSVSVEQSVRPGSWRGIDAKLDWEKKGWALAIELGENYERVPNGPKQQ